MSGATQDAPGVKGGRRAFVLPVALLGLWVMRGGSTLLPAPGEVLHVAGKLLFDGTALAALWVSLLRDLAGLAIGSLIGIVLGIAVGMHRGSARLLGTTLDVLKLVSPFAWIPLIMAWFGLGEASKIAFIALVAFLPVTFSTIEALAATPRGLIELGRVQRLSTLQTLRLIALPSALPGIFNGVYLALVATWMATIGAEYMLTSGGGIGAELVAARDAFAMADLLLYVGVVGLVGFAFHRIAHTIETRALHWRRTLALVD